MWSSQAALWLSCLLLISAFARKVIILQHRLTGPQKIGHLLGIALVLCALTGLLRILFVGLE
jgi:uncharacterized membrane protein (DUF373 family)